AHLSGEEQIVADAGLPGLTQDGRTVDIGVAVNHAETYEVGILQAGDQAQHAGLISPFDLRLEADEAPVIAGEVVLPQLYHGVGAASRAWIHQSDRLHRPQPQRVAPAVRHHLNRQTALEKRRAIEVVHRRRFRGD